MPIPDPRANEKKETYISRCMDRWQKDHGHPEKAEK